MKKKTGKVNFKIFFKISVLKNVLERAVVHQQQR